MTLPASNLDIVVRLLAANMSARAQILGSAMDANPGHVGSMLIDVVVELLTVADGLLQGHPDQEKLSFIFHGLAELADIKTDIETG